MAPAGKQRALRALKHVLQALKSECLNSAVPMPCSMLRCDLWRSHAKHARWPAMQCLSLAGRTYWPDLCACCFPLHLQTRSLLSQHPVSPAPCRTRVRGSRSGGLLPQTSCALHDYCSCVACRGPPAAVPLLPCAVHLACRAWFAFLLIAHATSNAEFEELASGIQAQRRALDSQCKALLMPLRQLWERHTAALLAGGPGWERHGAAAAAALLATRELMHVLQDFDGVEDAFTALFTELHQAAAAIAPQVLSGPMAAAAVAAAAAEEAGGAAPPGADPQQAQRWQLLTKNWERLLQVALVTMDR